MKLRINIITLAVDDLEKSLTFYRDGMGLPTKGIADITDGGDHILFELHADLSLVLFLRTEVSKIANQSAQAQRSAEFILSHVTESKEEVDFILQSAKAAGGTLPSQPSESSWGYSGYFQDPDGHLWEIMCFT
jgi:uncharacterized protein